MKKIELIATKRVLADLDKIDVSIYEKVKTPEWESSDEHKTLLHEIFEKAKQIEKLAAIKLKRLRTSLIAAILVIATLITTVACVEPVRKFLIEITEKFTHLIAISDEHSKTQIEEIYLPTEIPDNAVELQSNVSSMNAMTLWMDGEDMIVVLQLADGANTSMDTENTDAQGKLRISGMEVRYTLKFSTYNFIWKDHGYIFTLSCPERYTLKECKNIIRSFELSDEEIPTQ